MGWTYSGDPSNSTMEQVRFLIGDTISVDPLLQDEEINHLLGTYPSAVTSAIFCCEAIAARFSRQADKSVGEMSISASSRAKAYADRAHELRVRRREDGLTLFIGGRTISGKDTFKKDTDAVQPSFEIGRDDYPSTKPDPQFPWRSF